ncbi:hypothetical protein RND71_034116 [Anisodus tanguticus]|uniref:Uncharacterized protein n=1 Tax=Anisodus tanguticus TaxID=243964 RepID=A0AAE1RC29_9SOLA|nr:hypothetical protein RND71_034116 [Anisodus tanguticus]
MNRHNHIDKEDCNFHLVSSTSSTLGSLRLDPLKQHIKDDQLLFEKGDTDERKINKEEFEMGLIEAKKWSQMINEKILKVVPKTPISTPPGEPESVDVWELMEDLEDINLLKAPNHLRSFSFSVLANPYDQLTPRLKSNCEITDHKLVQRDESKGLGVKIDERDVSMHAGFKEERKELLLGEENSGGVLLPRVCLGRKFIGGVDEICRMHENGQLEKIVESCERSMMKKKLKKISMASNDAQIAMKMGLHDA